MRAIAACFLFLMTGVDSTQYVPQRLRLSVLSPDCSLTTKWIGAIPNLPEGVFLRCSEADFLVTSPGNLYGHVRITSGDAALEFVRFFTTAESYRYFNLDGMVEVLPGRVTSTSAFNVVDPSVFAKRLTSPTVVDLGGAPRQWAVTRSVVALDQKIYEVREIIDERGLYLASSKRVLVPNAQKLGLHHFGNL